MTHLDSGPSLWCSFFDPSELIAATAFSILHECFQESSLRLHLLRAAAPEQVLGNPTQPIGLALWHVADSSLLTPVCHALQRAEGGEHPRQATAVRLVFVARELSQHQAVIGESGAQMVVGDVPSLYRVLSAIGSRLPQSDQGSHPLTSGLSQRLPWPELAE